MNKGSPHSAIVKCEFRNEHKIDKTEFHGFQIRHWLQLLCAVCGSEL